MKIYLDKDLTQEITLLDLGIVPAGETKQFIFYVFNDSGAHLKELEFSVEHEEVKITQAPEELIAHDSDQLILRWSPSVTLKEGLKAQLNISGTELWG
jgi:hypothetical protein